MNPNELQNLFADRIGGKQYGQTNEIFKFEKIKRAKRTALKTHPERPLLDFGIGENDEMAPLAVRECLKQEVDKPENRGYPDNGIIEYKEAAAQWLESQFGVKLDPVTQICHSIGSKSALALLPSAFINPGDGVLMTVPGYPVLGTHTKFLGGFVHELPLTRENNFLPDLKTIPETVLEKCKILVINYPNSPTGAVADAYFFEEAIKFANQNKMIIVHDAAHVMLTYNKTPLSFLEIDGALETGIEVHLDS